MDAGAVRRACLFVCRHGSLLTATDLDALRALVATNQGLTAPGAGPEPHSADASGRAGALTRSALAILDAEYFTHDLHLQSVASRLHVTHWHLSRVLHHTTGQSFLAHLHQRRVAAAERMLLSGPSSRSIKEIAYDAGYASTRDLDRHFTRATGMTPGEYRRLLSPPS